MALSVKGLLYKREDLSVNPGTYIKWGAVVYAIIVLGGEVWTGGFLRPWPSLEDGLQAGETLSQKT